LSNSSFRNPSRREVLSSPALRDLTLFVRNDEDTPEIVPVAPAGALDGEPINTLCGTVLAANPVSSTLVFQRQLRKKT
jgi:hypothetical protein